MDASPPNRGRRWSVIWLTTWLAVGAFALVSAFASTQPTDPEQYGGALGRNSGGLVIKPIAEVRLGDLVMAWNPELADSAREVPDPDPATWRQINLQMATPDGGKIAIELLRPLDWIEQAGAEPGAQIHLDMPEMHVYGPADVIEVSPCPELEQREAGQQRRMVAGRFVHVSHNTGNVEINALAEPIGCTLNHPFWSRDRQEFVRAGDLRPNELLHIREGREIRIKSVTPARPKPSTTSRCKPNTFISSPTSVYWCIILAQ